MSNVYARFAGGETGKQREQVIDGLKSIMGSDLLAHTIIAAVIAVAFYMLSRVVRIILSLIGRKVIAKTETVLDDRILEVILAHVKPLMVVIGLHIAFREIHKGAVPSDLTLLQILEYSWSILYIAVVILVVKVLLGVIRVIIDWYLDSISAEGTADLKRTLGPLTGKVVTLLVGMVAAIVLLDHFGVNVGSMLVSLGVGSLAVALAAQDTLANMIAGFVILVDRPFRVGDRIELPTGQIGDVDSIGLRSTKMVNFDGNLIIIPNAELTKGRIVNYAYPHNQMRVQLNVEVAYGTDPAKVRRILLDIATKHPDVLKEPTPEVHFTAMKNSSIEFTLVAHSANYIARFAAETSMREQVYLTLAKEGIEIPFPQSVVHVKSDS